MKEYKRFWGEFVLKPRKLLEFVWLYFFRIYRIQLFEKIEMFEKKVMKLQKAFQLKSHMFSKKKKIC